MQLARQSSLNSNGELQLERETLPQGTKVEFDGGRHWHLPLAFLDTNTIQNKQGKVYLFCSMIRSPRMDCTLLTCPLISHTVSGMEQTCGECLSLEPFLRCPSVPASPSLEAGSDHTLDAVVNRLRLSPNDGHPTFQSVLLSCRTWN